MKLLKKKNCPAEGPAKTKAAESGKEAVKSPFPFFVNIIIIVTAAALLFASFIFPVMLISGDSMEPGLNDGNLILLIKTHDPAPGDLVGFKWDNKTLLKRVIACEGDWVMIDNDGRVYVNGNLLDEPYVSKFSFGESDVTYPIQVPEDSYFVMGDERESSLDSRSTIVGCIKDDQMIGKGILRIWPLF